jgi:cytochrome oxidase assembly protein ShyY1
LIRRPTFFSLALLCLGLAFFLMLGNWQLARARYKEALYASFVAGSKAPAHSLAQALQRWPTQSFVATEMRGEFIAKKTVLLDSQSLNGQIGVQVYQAFRSGVSRAWIFAGAAGSLQIPYTKCAQWRPHPAWVIGSATVLWY